MAKALSKSQVAAEIAEKAGLKKKQAAEILEHIARARLQERQEHFHPAGHRQAGAGQPQGPHRSQSGHRRADPDPGQARREVPRRQGRQGRNPRRQVIATVFRRHSDVVGVPFLFHLPDEDRIVGCGAVGSYYGAMLEPRGAGGPFPVALGLRRGSSPWRAHPESRRGFRRATAVRECARGHRAVRCSLHRSEDNRERRVCTVVTAVGRANIRPS